MLASPTLPSPFPSPSLSPEHGAGLVASLAGLLVVLVLLLFAVESLVGLYARSVATAAAADGARIVASDPDVRSGAAPTPATTRRAEDRVRDLLGEAGRSAQMSWSIDGERVALRLRTSAPRFLPRAWRSESDESTFERTVHVRIERLR